MGSTVRTAAVQNLRSKVTRVEFGEPLLVNQSFVTIPLLWTAFAPSCGSVKASKVALFLTEWSDREAVMWSPQTRIKTALSLLWFVWTPYAVCVFHFSLYFSLWVLIWGSAGTRDLFFIPSPRDVFHRTGHPLGRTRRSQKCGSLEWLSKRCKKIDKLKKGGAMANFPLSGQTCWLSTRRSCLSAAWF